MYWRVCVCYWLLDVKMIKTRISLKKFGRPRGCLAMMMKLFGCCSIFDRVTNLQNMF